jgi:Ca2+-binding RTX toxin-like protein
VDGAASTLPTAPLGPAETGPTPPVGPGPTPAGVEPTLPARPATPTFATGAEVRGNMDAAQLSSLLGASIEIATPTHLRIEGDLEGDVHVPTLDLVGTGFVYDANEQLRGGSVTGIIYLDDNFATNLTSSSPISAATFGQWVATNATQVAFATILSGNDNLVGFVGSDLIRGFTGNDVLGGLTGNDTIFGGPGDDQIFASGPGGLPPIYNERDSTYLRGDEGNDYIIGASGFDDANGNMGNDTISTGPGDDYCVGGKDSDLLFGDAGQDLVYGNLGADTCVGGDGNDIVRGGQDNDVVLGGAGNDFVSGDKGDDTMTGGAGADIFHTFGDAGIDRVVDFNVGEGDRVQLDPGTQFTVSQVGPDTVINMTGGGQMILANVSMSSLTGNWIFGA